MNIKTRIEDEEWFTEQGSSFVKIKPLNKRGIVTIEDYINCDIDAMFCKEVRDLHKGVQAALRYKYEEKPLPYNIEKLLEKQYGVRTKEFSDYVSNDPGLMDIPGWLYGTMSLWREDMRKLGISRLKSRDSIRIGLKIYIDIMRNNGDLHEIDNDENYKKHSYTLMTIDILREMAKEGNKFAQFYVDYYDKMKSQEKQTTDISEQIQSLEALKLQILSLTFQKKDIEDQINMLVEQVRTLEKEQAKQNVLK